MRKVVHKWFWAWEFDKEEKWLNEMAAKGLVLVSAGFAKFEFEQCLPGEYNIRLEMLEHAPTHAESQKYIEFIEETGAEQVGAFKKWVYFRKKTADGPFDLFSDYNSRIAHLKRIITLICPLGAICLYIGLYNLWLFYAYRSPMNLIGLLDVAIAVLVLIGANKLRKKKNALKKEQQIFE